MGPSLPLSELPRLAAAIAIGSIGTVALVFFAIDRSRRAIGLYALLALLLFLHLGAPVLGSVQGSAPSSMLSLGRVRLALLYLVPAAASVFLARFASLPASRARLGLWTLSVAGAGLAAAAIPLAAATTAAAAAQPDLTRLAQGGAVLLALGHAAALAWALVEEATLPRSDVATILVALGQLLLAGLLDEALERDVFPGLGTAVPLLAPAFLVFTALVLSVVADQGQRLFARATTDALTGLLNRSTFMTRAAQELARAGRTGRPLAVALLDIDHFKSFNDRFGHQTGDRVLAETARAVAQTIRGLDLAGRYGGEELIVLLVEADEESALAAVERIRAAIHAVALPGVPPICASAGIAVHHGAFDRAPLERLVLRADRALYESKRNGRDQATLERPAGPPRTAAEVRYR